MKRPFYWIFALLAAVSTLLLVGPANALPPGGPSSNTPGTSSTISPGTLQAGDTLSFTLSGFPAGEQVYIKIDNGDACPADAAQGACVVHQQKTDGSGSASGSFVLPTDLAEGEHTLRFLATEVMRDSSGAQIGTSGYSNQSPVFTVTGVNRDSVGANYTNVDAEVINQIENSVAESNANASESGSQGSTGGASTTVRNEETVYLDASGREVSKEEYDRLVAEAENTAAPAAETSAAESENSPEASTDQVSQSATATAASSASVSASQESSGSETAGESTETSSAEVPWVGLIAFGAAALAAVIIALRRRSAR